MYEKLSDGRITFVKNAEIGRERYRKTHDVCRVSRAEEALLWTGAQARTSASCLNVTNFLSKVAR